MNTRSISTYNQLRKLPMTRLEISDRALEIAELMTANPHPKNLVACIGRMKVLSKVVSDSYWDEKLFKGETLECYFLLNKDQDSKIRIVD
jgi:hypothetical protein